MYIHTGTVKARQKILSENVLGYGYSKNKCPIIKDH
jgi:hypothetical protein